MEPKPLRLAFGYQARVGKDTAAAYLVKRDLDLCAPLKTRGIVKSFAKAIYDIMSYAQQRCGFQQEKDRHFLQYIGTQWARAKDPDVWLNVILREIESQDPATPIFITDVRFPNEFDALEKLGFTMVNMRRDVGRADFGNGSTLHESETALIPYTQQGKWHVTINNNGTLEELYSRLDSHFPPIKPGLEGIEMRCPLCSRATDHYNKSKGRCISCYAPHGMGDDQEDYWAPCSPQRRKGGVDSERAGLNKVDSRPKFSELTNEQVWAIFRRD